MPDNPKWEGRSRGSKLGYRIFVWILRTFGLKPAYALLNFVALYYIYFVPAATKPLYYLYYTRLGYSKKEASKLIRQNIRYFGQTIIDKVVVLSGIKHNLTFENDGTHFIEEMLESGKGGFLVSAHLGNWEVAGHLLKRIEATINIVMYDGEAEEIKDYMDQFDRKRSFNIILIKDDMSHIYEMSAALARNELICIHADRFRPGNRVIEKEFLGEVAKFPAGPFILGSKLKAPVCFVFAFKETNFHYHFKAYKSKVFEGRGAEGMDKMSDEYIGLLEENIKKYPALWFNYFDFWKT